MRWEYWPPFVFYAPVALYVLWLGIRHRGLTLFTAANPAIEAGGFINESKAAILGGPRGGRGRRPAVAAPPGVAGTSRPSRATSAASSRSTGSRVPVVLKPDAGQRGSGVVIARSWAAIDDYLAARAVRRHRASVRGRGRVRRLLRA